jgi:hypothetical protein
VGSGLVEVFDVAMQVGHFANALAALRQREALAGPAVQQFDQDLRVRVRRAVAVATVARD